MPLSSFYTNHLTPCEIKVVKEVVNGGSYKAIAEKFYVSPRTIETHMNNVYKKIGIGGTLGRKKHKLLKVINPGIHYKQPEALSKFKEDRIKIYQFMKQGLSVDEITSTLGIDRDKTIFYLSSIYQFFYRNKSS